MYVYLGMFECLHIGGYPFFFVKVVMRHDVLWSYLGRYLQCSNVPFRNRPSYFIQAYCVEMYLYRTLEGWKRWKETLENNVIEL